MKQKHIIFLGAVLILLIGALVLRKFQRPAELVTEDLTPLNLKVDLEAVQKIEIEKPLKKIEEGKDVTPQDLTSSKPAFFTILKSSEGDWKIPELAGARADKMKIEELIKNINEAKGELRAKDKSLHKDFVIGDDEAFRIGLFDEESKELLTLYLGEGRTTAGIFVRQKGSDLVYVVDSDLLSNLGMYGDPRKEKPKVDYWASVKFFNFDSDKVQRMEAKSVVEGKEILTADIVREVDAADASKRKWKFARAGVPFSPDAEKLKQYLGALKDWNSNKVIERDPHKNYGFDKPRAQIKLTLEGGKELIVKVGEKDPDSSAYFAEASGEPVLYLFPDYLLQSFATDESRFFPNNPLAIDPDKTERLTVHTPEKEVSVNPKEKKWDSVTSYLNDLKNFAIGRLLFTAEDLKKIKSPAPRWLEVKIGGSQPQKIEVGEMLPGDKKEYAARKGETASQPFALSETNYTKFFQNLDRLAESKT